MTLLPAPPIDIQMTDGEPYELESVCSNPLCNKPADDRHHIVRRSETSGPVDWVEICGVRVGNVTGLCRDCHIEVTENRVHIFWAGTSDDTESGAGFLWDGESFLLPHPPMDGVPHAVWSKEFPSKEAPHSAIVSCKRCKGSGAEPPKEDPQWTEEEGEKPKAVFAVRIPKAELAWGHAALTKMVKESAVQLEDDLGYDEKTPPYFVLSAVLHDWLERRR